MTIETMAVQTVIACALPLWLLMEELLHRSPESIRQGTAIGGIAIPGTVVLAPRHSRFGGRASAAGTRAGVEGRRAKRIVGSVTPLVTGAGGDPGAANQLSVPAVPQSR